MPFVTRVAYISVLFYKYSVTPFFHLEWYERAMAILVIERLVPTAQEVLLAVLELLVRVLARDTMNVRLMEAVLWDFAPPLLVAVAMNAHTVGALYSLTIDKN